MISFGLKGNDQFWGWLYLMNFQQLLRAQHSYLKNQISQLKNAFDINRDILSILTQHDFKADSQHSIFMKIVAKLTTLNNQAMMSVIDLLQEKNVLKTEIYRLNIELNRLEERLMHEIENNNQKITCPTQARLLMHQHFNKLNRQLLAFNEEKMAFEQEIAHWKQNLGIINSKQKPIETLRQFNLFDASISKKSRIKRKYTSNQNDKSDFLLRQQQRQIKRLKQVIEELQNRLQLLIKAHNLEEQSIKKSQQKVMYKQEWAKQLQQVGLFKYALNVITTKKKDTHIYMNIIHRYRHEVGPEQKRRRKVYSFPKYKEFDQQITQENNLVSFVEKTLNTDDSK